MGLTRVVTSHMHSRWQARAWAAVSSAPSAVEVGYGPDVGNRDASLAWAPWCIHHGSRIP